MDESDDLSSLSSALSSPPDSDHELGDPRFGLDGVVDRRPSPAQSPTPSTSSTASKKRAPSPEHEAVLADNPDIAFIVMFRSRFNEAFSTKLAHLGPQDIERGVVDTAPSHQVEALLCALLGLVMNRKKPVERGHYGRALEEALATHKSEWPRAWQGMNPLSGARTFTSLSPTEKLTLLRTLIIWALHSSEVITSILKEKYKQARQEGDHNQPLSVQSWGADGSRRAYWLVEGQDDTHFRIYRERKSMDKSKVQWISVAESIDDLRGLASKLNDDGAQAARRLGTMITNAIPRFEATEEKRKRREYRVMRKAQFSRPESGYSLYEGRTRGKRARYTFSEDEESYSDAVSTRRSARHSGIATPSEPIVTASGRQVRSRFVGANGETSHAGLGTTNGLSPASGEYRGSEEPESGPPKAEMIKKTRPGWKGWALVADHGPREHIDGYNEVDAMEEDEDEASSSGESEGEWDGGDEEDDVIHARDADDEIDFDSVRSASDSEAESTRKSLVVTLRYSSKGQATSMPSTVIKEANGQAPLPSSDQPATKESGPINPDVQYTATPGLALASSPHAVSTEGPTVSRVHPSVASGLGEVSAKSASSLPESKLTGEAVPVLDPDTVLASSRISPQVNGMIHSSALNASSHPAKDVHSDVSATSIPQSVIATSPPLPTSSSIPAHWRQGTLDGHFLANSMEGSSNAHPQPSSNGITSSNATNV